MAGEAKFPADPFWDYSLSIYARPGVADAGIALQDEYGLDVNILLACLWCAAAGPGRLDSGHIRECVERTRDWQARVVEPLRKVRRYCKAQPEAVPQELRQSFRPGVQAIELDAEHVEQLVLSETLRTSAGAGSRISELGPAGADAIQNLLAYLALQDVALDSRVAGLLGKIVAAAFPQADLAPLLSPA